MKTFISVTLLFLSLSASAAYPAKMYVIGKVKNISSKQVEIETGKGLIRVPKSTIIQPDSLRPGQKTTAYVSWLEIIESNRGQTNP